MLITRSRIAGIALAGALALVQGCGVGELGAAAATGGAPKAAEAEQAERTKARVEQQLEDAAAEAAKRRAEMDAQLE